MILVEETLETLFDTLKVITVNGSSYNPDFGYGSYKDLLKFLKHKHKEGGKIYPIIWMETPVEKKGNEKKRITANPNLVLATLSNAELSNKERLDTRFKQVLYPLLKEVQHKLNFSGYTRIVNKENVTVANHFNYAVNDEHTATDIWDAIKFNCELEIKNC